jgi:PAS domain S-box-containing protein
MKFKPSKSVNAAAELQRELGQSAQEITSAEEALRLMHELQIHQIELELQNEELRRTQEALELSRARYFDLYDLAPVSYVTLNAEGLVKEANLTAATVLQVARNDLTLQPLSRFIAAEDQDRYYMHLRQLVTTGVPQQCELRLKRADGSPLWVRLEATTAQDAPSEATVYRMVMSDISGRVQAEIALRELNDSLVAQVAAQTADLRMHGEHLSRTNSELTQALRLKDEFLAMMSHELRTPLNVILGITEAMCDGLYGSIDVRQQQSLATVAQSGRHLLTILSDILDLARIGAGKERLTQQPIDIALLCDTARMFVAPAAETKQITLVTGVVPPLSGLVADERRLTQILVNLLDNAVKFTPAGGTVGLEVSANSAEERVTFVVWDTGIGIAEADFASLFQLFTQLDGKLSRCYNGVGLGLTLASRLVELHGGSITVESKLGQGSRFSVNLPWTPEDALAVATLPAPPTPQRWAHAPRVLLADDHEVTLQVYADLLRRQGCDVVIARDGLEAVALAQTSRPEVAVLDIQLPGMDGLAAMRQLRAEPALAALPLIALTALAMPGDRERCMAAGATAYLAKPVSLRTLLATITQVLALTNARAA